MITYYCPACWSEIQEGNSICPFCGFELAQDSHLSFENKLLKTLDHPVQDQRILAIRLLGNINSHQAIPHFKEKLRNLELPVFEVAEILIALNKIPGLASQLLIYEALDHPYPIIQNQAEKLLFSNQSDSKE